MSIKEPDIGMGMLIMITLLAVAAGLIIACCCSGCNSECTWPWQKPPQIVQPQTPQQQLWQTVKKSNWLTTLAIPIIALGAVAVFNGAAKLGFSTIIFGCVNLFMALATARFALWMSIFGLIGSVAAVAASILSKNKALIEIIRGIQKSKTAANIAGADVHAGILINRVLSREQSPPTQKIVQTVKTNLKLKGEI